MDKISVKMSDINLRGTDSAKSAGQVRESSDDFKKLLQGQNDNGSKDVSKDAKTEKTEPVKEQKKEEPAKADNAQEEAGKEEQVQNNGLLAAYQMAQNFQPEMIQPEPETAVVEVMPEEVQLVPDTELVSDMAEQTAEVQVAETVQVQQAEPEKAAGEVRFQTVQPVQEVQPETKTTPVQQKAETSGEQESMAQPDSRLAEQAVQVQNPEPSTAPAVQEMKPQEPARIQVPQPEELPEKVTDQLMAKISEGVQEFEIHIEPANLGKIAVRILYQEGQATVSIMCSEKKAFDILGRNAGEIGQIIDKNLGGTTTIVVDKQENDYLNQTRDENQKNGQNGEQERPKDGKKEQNPEDAQDFLQKLRLGLTV